VPCGITASMSADDKKQLYDKCEELCGKLKSAGVLVSGDFRDNYSPGWKFNHWELKVILYDLLLRMKDICSSCFDFAS
jgi:hypothetical protein